MLSGNIIDDPELFSAKLQEWEQLYTFECRHGGLGGQTPYERLRQKTTASSVIGQSQSHSPLSSTVA
jgi:hypothetical protein